MTSKLSLISNLTPEQRQMFESRMQVVRKNPSSALLLSVFALGRFYLGQLGIGILQWLLAPLIIGLWWMIIDIFTIQVAFTTST